MSKPDSGRQIDLSDVLQNIRERESKGLLPEMPTIAERMKAQGKEHLRGIEHLPVADFEFDVDEFLRIIYDGRSE